MPDPSLHLHLHRMVALGLNTYEAKAYLALVLRESWAATDLANHAGIPRQRIYDVLSRLMQRGLARDRPGRVTRYSATDPDTAIQRLIAVQRQELDELSTRSQDLALTLRRAWERGQGEGEAPVRAEVLREAALAGVRSRELVDSARAELCVLVPAQEGWLLPDPDGVTRLHEDGGLVRLLVQGPVEHLGALRDAGAEVRGTDHAAMGLVLADRRTVLVRLASAGGATDLVVEHEALAASLQVTFEEAWERAARQG
ncbi:TrmB family transcriptional regulator [Oryzihumus sp.]|uniref:TrmB family transcriptional regulator n=1 Tax=Oryzihumus sp. TaxID=1968903 RepID=UPI002EDB67D0